LLNASGNQAAVTFEEGMALKYFWFASVVLAATLARAAEPVPLLDQGEQAVTFVLKDKRGKVPQLSLFTSAAHADTADSINFWRGTTGLGQPGVAVQFKGLRFLRERSSSDALIVRLVGIKNELELTERVSLADLHTGKPLRLHFGPVAIGAGFITGTTDAEMLLSYNPTDRTLVVEEVSGEFEWKRLFHDPQKDSGSLTEISGEVGEVPPGGTILRASN
jgi:hypothetical protein